MITLLSRPCRIGADDHMLVKLPSVRCVRPVPPSATVVFGLIASTIR